MADSLVGGARLTLDLWHPNCWAIEATEDAAGGVLAHAIYDTDRRIEGDDANGLFTAFGDSNETVETLLDAIRDSEHAGEMLELQERFDRSQGQAPGNVVREFFLEYDPDDMVCPTLLDHGFFHSAPVRIEAGREYWQVYFAGDRSEIEGALDGVREDAGAEVTVSSITSGDGRSRTSEREQRLESLTPVQREVFEYARNEGYYEWPRQTSTRELAEGLGRSKTTLLEHLRKAESKLLDP
ncbi:MAG: helix-turn-helix domain-containing protein [Halobacteriales archaeon]|nr:helix-turn-helix domain-containing protein [Halobacteriales archaeon]